MTKIICVISDSGYVTKAGTEFMYDFDDNIHIRLTDKKYAVEKWCEGFDERQLPMSRWIILETFKTEEEAIMYALTHI